MAWLGVKGCMVSPPIPVTEFSPPSRLISSLVRLISPDSTPAGRELLSELITPVVILSGAVRVILPEGKIASEFKIPRLVSIEPVNPLTVIVISPARKGSPPD